MHLTPLLQLAAAAAAALGILSFLAPERRKALSIKDVLAKVYESLEEINNRVDGAVLKGATLTLRTVGSRDASVSPVGLFSKRQKTQELVLELEPPPPPPLRKMADESPPEMELDMNSLVESVVSAVRDVRSAAKESGDLDLEKTLTVTHSFDAQQGASGGITLSSMSMQLGRSHEIYHDIELGFKLSSDGDSVKSPAANGAIPTN